MKSYRVQYEIDVEANSTEEAAQQAHDIILNRGPERTHFWSYAVQEWLTGKSELVNLDFGGKVTKTD